jgi:hypothetical protein
MFFLTEVDTERLNIRGSRDPLGLVPVWGAFGRKVVGNLTTASSSVRGFTTLLLAFYFAERIQLKSRDGESPKLAVFLKFEQLAGFVRKLRNDDDGIRGITEIKRRLAEHGLRKIRIGSSTDLQILSNQKTYGLWGLYTIPAVDSDLLVRKDIVLTGAARDLIEREYLPVFRAAGLGEGRILEDALSKGSFDFEPEGRHEKLANALAKILSPAIAKRERPFYHYHLVQGGPKGEETKWQPRFAEMAEAELKPKTDFDHQALTSLIRAAGRRAEDQALKHHLEKIRDLEALLVTMGNLFGFLQRRDGATLKSVRETLKETWGTGLSFLKPAAVEEMQPELARVYADADAGARVVRLAEALHGGDFAGSIDLLLEHNSFVMKTRHNSQPWVHLEGGALAVRYRDDSQVELQKPRQLATAWRSSFYLNPLKAVIDQLRTP